MEAEDILRLKQQEHVTCSYLPKAEAVGRVIDEIEHELKLIKNHVNVELYDTTHYTEIMLQQNLELLTDVLTQIKSR